MALSKETINKLRQVKRAILAEPEFYDQGRAVYAGDSCGTPCCIQGWVLWVANPNPKAYTAALSENSAAESLARGLGVDKEQADLLFAGGERQFPDMWNPRKDPVTRARSCAARIDAFIESGGRV